MSLTAAMLGGAAIGAAGSLFGSAASAGFTSLARRQNFEYNEMAAENADARARQFFYDIQSPKAQIEQLKEAGLSPSMYFGQNGGAVGYGGTQGAGAAGPQSGFEHYNLGIDPLTMSQIKLNEAQAEKTEAEAATEKGENERGSAEIAKIWAEKGATDAAAALTKSQNKIAEIEATIANATSNEQMWKIRSEASKAASDAERAYFEAQKSSLDFNFDLATFYDKQKLLKEQIANMISSTQLNYDEAAKIVEEMWYIPDEIEVKQLNAESYAKFVESECANMVEKINLRKKELKVEQWRIGVNAVEELVRTGGYVIGAGMIGKGGNLTPSKSTLTTKGMYDYNANNKDFKKTTREAYQTRKGWTDLYGF